MKWVQALLLMALGLAGCKNQTPTVDPFFGRTRIPPPPTGSASGSSVNPYAFGSTIANSGTTAPPAYAHAPSANASGWVPATGSGTSSPGLLTPPGQPSANYAVSPNAPTTTAPSFQPGVSASPVSNPSAANQSSTPGVNPLPGGSAWPSPVQPNGAVPGAMPGTYPPANSNPNLYPNASPAPNLNISIPPGGCPNSWGLSAGGPTGYQSSPSSTRVPRPYFAGGAPNRTSIPVESAIPQPIDNTQGGVLPWGGNFTPPGCVPTPLSSAPVRIAGNPLPSSAESPVGLRPIPDAIGSPPVANVSYTATPVSVTPGVPTRAAQPCETPSSAGWQPGEGF